MLNKLSIAVLAAMTLFQNHLKWTYYWVLLKVGWSDL